MNKTCSLRLEVNPGKLVEGIAKSLTIEFYENKPATAGETLEVVQHILKSVASCVTDMQNDMKACAHLSKELKIDDEWGSEAADEYIMKKVAESDLPDADKEILKQFFKLASDVKKRDKS